MRYEVFDDGKCVFQTKTNSDVYEREAIPEEFRARPQSGERVIKTDDEVISVMGPEPTPPPDEQNARQEEHTVSGEGTVTNPRNR